MQRWLTKSRLLDGYRIIMQQYLIKVDMQENKYICTKKDVNKQKKIYKRKYI